MGHDAVSTLIFVGLARLPQSCASFAPTIAVEVEVELQSRRVVGAGSTLQLPGLAQMLRDVLVGTHLDDARKALLDLEVRYSAPFSTALSTAIERAIQRAKGELSEAESIAAAPPSANGDAADVSCTSTRVLEAAGSGR